MPLESVMVTLPVWTKVPAVYAPNCMVVNTPLVPEIGPDEVTLVALIAPPNSTCVTEFKYWYHTGLILPVLSTIGRFGLGSPCNLAIYYVPVFSVST